MPNPEAEGINNLPLIENPARDIEIFPQYSDAADRFVKKQSWQRRHSIQGFILSALDLVFEEEDTPKAVRILTRSFEEWKKDCVKELNTLQTEPNIASTITKYDLEEVYRGGIIGYDDVLDLSDMVDDRLYARPKEQTLLRWERFVAVANIAAAQENRNVA